MLTLAGRRSLGGLGLTGLGQMLGTGEIRDLGGRLELTELVQLRDFGSELGLTELVLGRGGTKTDRLCSGRRFVAYRW